MVAWPQIDDHLTGRGLRIVAPRPGQAARHCQSGSWHCSGMGARARDYGIGDYPAATLDRIANLLSMHATGQGAVVRELFWWNRAAGRSWFFKNGEDRGLAWARNVKGSRGSASLADQHDDHLHVALWPGRSLPVTETKIDEPGGLLLWR